MTQYEACPTPCGCLDTKGETGAGIKVEDETDDVSHRVGHSHMGMPHQQQIHAILYQCGCRSYGSEADNLAQFLPFVSV